MGSLALKDPMYVLDRPRKQKRYSCQNYYLSKSCAHIPKLKHPEAHLEAHLLS